MPKHIPGRPVATHQYSGIACLGNIKTKDEAEVHSYADAELFLGKEKQRVIASNVTVVRLSRTAIGIRLYSTFVITYYKDGTFEADDGNGVFATQTTASRCSQFGPKGRNFYIHNKRLGSRGYQMCKGKLFLVAGGERLWVRLGDADGYNDFDGLQGVIDYLSEMGVYDTSSIHHSKYSLELPGYEGKYNHISLFWGDAKGEAVRSLDGDEIKEFNKLLKTLKKNR